ncbi:MAG: tetratricopeptide repeat protein, partial [Acetatifactor sp.]|nr:tetratricopeptide repeat protein [Acetatifactor sp.]
SGRWVEQAAGLYSTLSGRQDLESWRHLFTQDIYLSLDGEEECQSKLLVFLMQHFRLPTAVWKLLEEKLEICKNQSRLKEQFPVEFIDYLISRITRGEDVEFYQFNGPEDGDYDAFLQCYDDCWRALQEENLEYAVQLLEEADHMGIGHPCMEVCRAHYYQAKGRQEEARDCLMEVQARFPGDELIEFNLAQLLWDQGQTEEAARRFEGIRERNDKHYMANMRLAEWYHRQGDDHRAKKCAEEVLIRGYDDSFYQLLKEINAGLERELEEKIESHSSPEDILELGWCYLQDERFSVGIRKVKVIENEVPQGRWEEYLGLMAKLYREAAQYEDCIRYAKQWREALEKRIPTQEGEAREKDEDRLRQSHAICLQCYMALGYLEKSNYSLALEEADAIEAVNPHDLSVLLERARIYLEMEEYDQCITLVRRLVDEYRVYAALSTALEVYRRQWDAGGVIQTARQLIQYFPDYAKSYVDMARVYLDLQYKKELEELLEEAKEKGISSPYLEAYAYQKDHEADSRHMQKKVEEFRNIFLDHVENGDLSFYEPGLKRLTEYLYQAPGAYLLVERGIFHKAAHHYEEAIKDYEQVLLYVPQQIYALNGMSQVYKHRGEYEQAIICLRKAILFDTEGDLQPGAYMDMADLYMRLADYERALEYLKQYVESADNKGVNISIYRMGKVATGYIRCGQCDMAEKIWGTAYAKDPTGLYDKLVDMYQVTGQSQAARDVLQQWARRLNIDESAMGKLFGKRKKSNAACGDYYVSLGWTELVFGEKNRAVKAFVNALDCQPDLDRAEGTLCDAVFAFILCGEEKLGKKYGAKLQEWLRKEKFSKKNEYYEQEKGHLQIEFLADYYTEPEGRLQELLDRESQCECCNFCTYAICKELEGVRVLLMLRMGRREEAKERLIHNLKIQPQDEYMLAIKHICFGEER